jgi:hypothetical protein
MCFLPLNYHAIIHPLMRDTNSRRQGAGCCGSHERFVKGGGIPNRIPGDSGSEFISKVLDKLAYENEVMMYFPRSVKSMANAMIDSLKLYKAFDGPGLPASPSHSKKGRRPTLFLELVFPGNKTGRSDIHAKNRSLAR